MHERVVIVSFQLSLYFHQLLRFTYSIFSIQIALEFVSCSLTVYTQ